MSQLSGAMTNLVYRCRYQRGDEVCPPHITRSVQHRLASRAVVRAVRRGRSSATVTVVKCCDACFWTDRALPSRVTGTQYSNVLKWSWKYLPA